MSVWSTIARLRQRDPHLLAPAIMKAWDRGRVTCSMLQVNVADAGAAPDYVAMDLLLMETLRVQELQDIYLRQGTTKAADVMRSHHAYGTALDVVHREFYWFTNKASIARWPDKRMRQRASIRWFRAVANILTCDGTLAWGGLWKSFPDSPHFQAAALPRTPSLLMRGLYDAAGGGEPGRRAVWEQYKLI